MNTFTAKIYSEFKQRPDLHGLNANGVVLPEDRWTRDSVRTTSLLDLVSDKVQFDELNFSLKSSYGSQIVPVDKYHDIFDHILKTNKNSAKTSSSLKKDLNALKYIGFASAEHNLQTLLRLDRQSVKRGVIQTSLASGQTQTRFKILLFHLAEANFDNHQTVARQDQHGLDKSYFEDAEILIKDKAQIKNIKSELLVLQGSLNLKQLERYLQDSPRCQSMYTLEPATSITLEQLELDLVCREIAENLQSPQILVRFASLTGNVTYLIRAIHLLLKNQDQYLLEEQVSSNSIICQKTFKGPGYLNNKVLVTKHKALIELSENRLLKLNSKNLRIFVNTEIGVLEVEKDGQPVKQIGFFEEISSEDKHLIRISPYTKDQSDPANKYVFVYFHSFVDGNFKFYKRLLDTVQMKWLDDQKLEWQKVTNLLQKIVEQELKSLDAIRVWGDSKQRFLSFVFTKKHAENFQLLPENEWKSEILTIDVDNKCNWVHHFDCLIRGFELVESNKTAAVIVSTELGEELLFKYLPSGKFSKLLTVGKGETFAVKVEAFSKGEDAQKISTVSASEPIPPKCTENHLLILQLDGRNRGWRCDGRNESNGCYTSVNEPNAQVRDKPRWRCEQCDFDYCGPCYDSRTKFGKKLPMEKVTKQNDDDINSHWWWIKDSNKLVFNLVNQVCKWSDGDVGSYTFDQSTQKITIKKGAHEVSYLLSEDGFSLTADECKDQVDWPVKLMRCVGQEHPREIGTQLDMVELLLTNHDVKVTCEFGLQGGGTGREYASNLINPIQNDWCKWCAVDCTESQSWVLFDFKKKYNLDGIGFTSANDDYDRDPQYAEVHYMQHSGTWVHLGAVKLNFDARHQTISFGFQKTINAKAMIFNLGKYERNKNPSELQLGQIKLFQDPKKFELNLEQQTQSKHQITPFISNQGQENGSLFVTNYTNGSVFSLMMVKYPILAEDLVKSRQRAIQVQVSKYFGHGNQVSSESKSALSAVEWALYLAKLVNNHTEMRTADEKDNLVVRWLHKQPTKDYFDAIADLFLDEAANPLVLEYLHQSVADNLNAYSRFEGAGLSNLIGEEKLKKLVVRHAALRPSIINYYRIACSPEQKPLKEFVEQFSQLDPRIELQLKFTTLCEQLLNFGDFTNFLVTWNELQLFRQTNMQCGLILVIGNVVERSEVIVPVPVIKFLIEKCNTFGLNTSLKKDVQQVIWKVISQQFLKHVNRTKHSKYDHKGYLVTQSELLSGGIDDKQINIFSPETHQTLSLCADFVTDESLKKTISGAIKAKPAEEIDQIETKTVSGRQNDVFSCIIHSGQDQLVDEIISVFQKSLIKKGGIIARQCQVGQEIGMRLVRAAFASIIKLQSKAQQQFQDLKDELELMNGEDIPLENGQERDDAICDICTRSTNYSDILKLWISATKMRGWLTVKIQSVSQKYQKRGKEESDVLEEAHMQKIYKQIVEKAELLIKIDPPKQKIKTQIQTDQLKRTPSYIPPKFATIQTSQQIQAHDQAQTEKLLDQGSQDACEASVLACLQSPVLAIEIQDQIETSYLEAVKRFTGLTLVLQTISAEDKNSEQTALEVVNLLSILQKKEGTLSHYLDGISGGCNLQLEANIRKVFFEILENLAKILASTTDHEVAFTLVYSFQWAYHARDFDLLLRKVNIFNTLTKGNSQDCLVAQTWCKFNTSHPTLSKDLLLSFKDIFMTILARVSDPAADNKTQLKTFGNENLLQAVPKLVRVRSQLDENSSSLLIDSALRVIFRYFDTFIANKQKLEQLPLTHKLVEQIKDWTDSSDIEKNELVIKNISAALNQLQGAEQQTQSQEIKQEALELANIEVQIDTTTSAKLQDKQQKPVVKVDLNQEENRKGEEARDLMVQTFIQDSELTYFGHLLDCIQIFSSVSKTSKNTAKMLKHVASPYYVRTLLHLVVNLSLALSFCILQIIEDLVLIDASLVDYQDDLKDKTPQIYNSCIANFLYNFAKEALKSKTQFVLVKQVVRIIRRLNIVEQHERRMLQLKDLEVADQVLSLMICNCGAELETIQSGDLVTIIEKKLPIDQNFYVTQANLKTVLLYSQYTDVTVSHARQDLILVPSGEPICYPDQDSVIQLIISSQTNALVKTVLVNLVLRNLTRYAEIIPELGQYVQKYIVNDYLEQREREYVQTGQILSPFLTEYIEDQAFSIINEELLKPPKQITDECTDTNKPLTRRTLIRSFFKQKKKKENKFEYTSVESAYYELFWVKDTLYHLIENPILQNDRYVAITTTKAKLPLHFAEYRRIFVKNRVMRVRRIMESWADQTKVKALLQSSKVLMYKHRFSKNFSYMIQNEADEVVERKRRLIKIKSPDCANLLFQRMNEFLFKTFKPTTEVQKDDEVLWHLNRYYIQRSVFQFTKRQSAKDLSKRWFDIVNSCDPNWIQLYVKRSIKHGFQDAEQIWDTENEEDLCYMVNRPLRIVFKLIQQRYDELAAEFLTDFCEVQMRQLVATKTRHIYYFKINRRNLKMVQDLLTMVHQKKDFQLFDSLMQNTMLPDFLEQACTSKNLYQFGYVGRLIYAQVLKIDKELRDLGILTFELRKHKKDQFQALITEYQTVVTENNLLILTQMSESKQDALVFENALELKSEQFGEWIQIKNEQPGSEFDSATIQLAAYEGTGIALVAVSDEPLINENTKFSIVNAGNITDIVSIQTDAKKAAFLMYPIQRNFIQKFKHFKPDQNQKHDISVEFDSDDCQLFNFEPSGRRKDNWVFVSTQQGLFLDRGKVGFEQIKGIQGKTVSVQQLHRLEDEKFVFQTEQRDFFMLRTKEVDQKKSLIKSFYRKSKNDERIEMEVTLVQQKDDIHTYSAVTVSNEVLSIVAVTVFEMDVSVTIMQDEKEIVTLACKWTDENKKVLRGQNGNIYLKVSKKREFLSVKQLLKKDKLYKPDQKVEFLSLVHQEDEVTFAAVVDGYVDFWTNPESNFPTASCQLPEEVDKVIKIHCAYESSPIFDNINQTAFFIEATHKDQTEITLYWVINNKATSSGEERVILDLQLAKHQNFSKVYNADGKVFAIDQEGEIWVFFDFNQSFTPESAKQSVTYKEDQPQIKTTLMKQRMSKAVDLILTPFVRDKTDLDCPRIKPGEQMVLLLVKRTRVLTENKTEESFECIPGPNSQIGNWPTKVAFNLNQIYYRENKYVQQSNNKTMDIISESIGLGNQCFLVKPNAVNVPTLKYKLYDPNNPNQLARNFSTEEISNCKDFLNSELKQNKAKQLQIGLLQKKKRLTCFIKSAKSNSEGHSQQLVQIILAANQMILDSLPVTRAKAHDGKFQQMLDFTSFAERFALPTVMELLILLIQKTLRPATGNYDQTVRFQRLNSTENLFDQLYRQTSNQSRKMYLFKQDPERPFRSRFIGENAYDAGGPFRDVMDDICAEITETFFRPTNNMAVTGESSYQPKLLIDVLSLAKFRYLGNMIGWSLRQWNYNISLDMNPLFWKRILEQPINYEDIKDVDKYRYQLLRNVLDNNYTCTFEVDLGTGQEVLLCEGGQYIQVNEQNSQEFVRLYLEKYLDQDEKIHEAIRSGVKEVCAMQILRHLTVQAASDVAFSTPKVSSDELLSRIKFNDDAFIFPITRQLFERMIKEFSNKERQLLLKFVTGSSRLTNQGHAIELNGVGGNYEDDVKQEDYLLSPEINPAHKQYPVGHTCGKSVDLPDYTDFDIMCTRFRTAILTCGEIDDDGNYYDSEQDRAGEGESSSEGEDDDQDADDDSQDQDHSDGEGESESEDEDDTSQIRLSEPSMDQSSSHRDADNSSNQNSNQGRSPRRGDSWASEASDGQLYTNLRFSDSDDDYNNGENQESELSESSHSDSSDDSNEFDGSQQMSDSSNSSGTSNSQSNSSEDNQDSPESLDKRSASNDQELKVANNESGDGSGEENWSDDDEAEEVDY